MIKSLAIYNYQSHKKTELEFDEGINIITGQSDSGKSAIIRALNWVINNKPAGDEFRSTWGGDTKVILETDNMSLITREKGENNLYFSGGDKYNSFGQDVPEEIKYSLNFSPLNIQGQFDSPFLLAMSGGEVARYLNKIVHLDVIDKSLSNIGKTLREEQQDLKRTKESLKEDEKKAKTFYWIDKAEGCLVKLEQFERTLFDRKIKHRQLEREVEKIEVCNEAIKEVSQVTQHEDEVNSLIKIERILKKNQNKADRLDSIIENILVIEGQMRTTTKNLDGAEYQFKAMMPNICPLCGRGE